MTYQSTNPFDGKVLKTFPTINDAHLETAVAAASTCYATWRHTSHEERAKIVHKTAELMPAKSDLFARTMTLDMGKRISEARGEVAFSADILDYYAKNVEEFLAPTKLNPKVGKARPIASTRRPPIIQVS